MKDITIRPGDVVELKSGGPNMTVTEVSSDGQASVVWIGNDEISRSACFHVACLLKI